MKNEYSVKSYLAVLLGMILITVALVIDGERQVDRAVVARNLVEISIENERLDEIESRLVEIERRQVKIERTQLEIIEAQITILEVLSNVFGFDAEVTAYAPMDEGAIEGMCFEGDPTITASGEKVEIGTTIAAGRKYPFGSRIWVEGFGIKTVHDRGGMISDRHIDVAVATRNEAFQIGRTTRRAVYLGGE
ncbi:MAG: hypothetical protein COA82_06720 [Alkaliphilus sp.]|nr:MAG: hypothetical protein COA82_06720 [Alkaliphilus sp.]